MENENLNSNNSGQGDAKQQSPIPKFEDANSVQNQINKRIEQTNQNQVSHPQQNLSQQTQNSGPVQQSQPINKQQSPIPRFEDATSNVNTNKNSNFNGTNTRSVLEEHLANESYFDGKMLDLLGLKILQVFITTLTFGLAAPWVSCVVYNYEFSHTLYNGKRLKFEGKPEDLFLNMFRWFFFTLITCGIYALVIPERKASWIVSNLHFENEPFVKGDSFFYGDTINFIGVNLLCYFLTGISFGLLYPFTVCYKLRWVNNHSVINRKKLVFNGKALGLFGNYILWGFLTLITFGIYGLWFELNFIKWRVKNTSIKGEGDVQKSKGVSKALIIVPVAILAVGLIALLITIIPSFIGNMKVDFPDASVRENAKAESYNMSDLGEDWDY